MNIKISERGQGYTEYALILVIVSLVAVVLAALIGEQVVEWLQTVYDWIVSF